MLAMVVSEKSLKGQWILIFKNFELKYYRNMGLKWVPTKVENGRKV